MIEVYTGLFVGNQNDFERQVAGQQNWAVVHACKDPYHRTALGYSTPGAPKGHSEYLLARRGDRLMLNLVDAPHPRFFDVGMMQQALDFIDEERAKIFQVLVHCNQGESRAPSIALLYLAARLNALPMSSFEAAEAEFQLLYPNYRPGMGIREHMRQNWAIYLVPPTQRNQEI